MSIETPYVCDVRIGGDLVQEWSMGTAHIAHNGRMRPCQVLASPAGEDYLLGATSLETLGFLVDPIAQVLVPTTTRV
jgi:predicted aspartyl protease